MHTLLNDISELIYVSDINTYDLLYMNSTGKETFHIDKLEGEKCYKVLQGLDSPCPFCNNKQLRPGNIVTWEITNPVTNRHYLLKDKLVDWSGKLARVEIAFDMTDQNAEKQALKQALDAERMILQCVKQLYEGTDLGGTFRNVLSEIGTFFDADRIYIFEIREDKMYNTYEWCAQGINSEMAMLQGMDTTLIDRWRPFFDQHQCVVIKDLEEIKETNPKEYRELSVQKIHSLIAAPLEKDGKLSGYIGVDNPPSEKIYSISSILQTLRYFLMSMMRRMEDEGLVTELSFNDMLTGFYNRNRYMKDLAAMILLEESVGVVYLDMNGLKDMNDRYGHYYGDQILLECSRKIKSVFQCGDLYRIGGDEFVIIVHPAVKKEFEDDVMELKNSFSLDTRYSVAIGSRWSEVSGDLPKLVAEADSLMYEDKRQFYRRTLSTDRYRHYNDDVLGLTDPQNVQMMIDRGQFLVFLQPKVSFANKVLVGAEALVRLQTLEGNIIPPDEFLPILEDSKLISKIDFFVFEFICSKIAHWQAEGKSFVPVSVNFSRYSLPERDFIQHLDRLTSQYSVDKKWLDIEITETVEGAVGFDVGLLVDQIRSAGYSVSIDDFGVHYANMALFSDIEFDTLKIDKSLIDHISTNHKAEMVVESLVGICKKLGIHTIVEGVETEDQYDALLRIGCEVAQGYLFSRPVPVIDYEMRYL